MTHLIDRPEYIEYSTSAIDFGTFTQEHINTLENEPAIFQWTLPHAFIWRERALTFHLKVLSLLGVPYLLMCLLFLIDIISNGVDPKSDYLGGAIYVGVIIFSVYAILYYLIRSQYEHVVYKITESGILKDQLKIFPRWRYGKQDPTNFVNFFRWLSIPFIVLALFIHPALLIGAIGMLSVGFLPIEVDEGEKAYYVALMWERPDLSDETQLTRIKCCPKRLIIQILSEDFDQNMAIYCTNENYEQIKSFLFNKLPNARDDGQIYRITIKGVTGVFNGK